MSVLESSLSRLTLLATAVVVAALPACTADSTSSDAEDTPTAESAAAATEAAQKTWHRVYRDDFTNMANVIAMQSGPAINGGLLPSDDTNGPLQKPTLAENVGIVSDHEAGDGHALVVRTRVGTYGTPQGNKVGWTNGRMEISGHEIAPPVRIRTRIRMTRSALTKTAVMFWPTSGWHWEVDFAENFGGASKTDFWGSR